MLIHRRRLLAAGALAPLMLPNRIAFAADAADVLVIGAGVAGIAAARDLAAAGLKVTLIEARNRIGGRTHTDTSLGVPVDMGAAWIHGADGNPITKLVKQAGISTRVTDFDSRALFEDGEQYDEDDTEEAAEQCESDVEALLDSREEFDDDATAEEGFETLLEDVDPEERAARRNLLSAEIEAEYGEDASALSLAALDEDEGFEGEDLLLRSGYGALVSHLAAGLDIKLEQIVKEIAWRDAGVQVRTNGREWRARKLIVAIPLGVLASGAVRFEPGLSTAKREAFEEIGMGSLGKRVLRFARPFWPESAERLLRLDAPAGRTVEIWNLLPLTGVPVLAMLSAGAHNRALERMSAAAAKADALAELTAMFGRAPPDPTGFVRTQWSTDPYALGSYSVVLPGGRLEAYGVLAEPIDEVVFFAGEATHERYPATVHGALLSGQRAAREVIKAMRGAI